LGPARIGPILGLPASTVHRILTRHHLHRLTWLDRTTGTVIRRYERDRPGELIHVDVKKLGRIPDGGGHKTNGREAGRPIRGMGFDYVHSAVDDHSRLAYSEIHSDEKVATCAGFLTRAAAFFHSHGIDHIERVLTDNAWAYRRGLAWKNALAELGATGKLTRAYRPQTNGKVERFNRTLLDEWAYLKPYHSNNERTEALADFLHTYNHHRCHTALGGKPPISRVNNPASQYT
ncbi:IS481 family transposase, partial [Streptomyces sp. NPDC006464]|uniref:IS481 family transposase n=1 Tax=Streptomyces sp. NPDC006464 TaxID=3154305 RepID=UPI0033A60F02